MLPNTWIMEGQPGLKRQTLAISSAGLPISDPIKRQSGRELLYYCFPDMHTVDCGARIPDIGPGAP